MMKYKRTGTPKPKKYTTNTAYLTNYSLNMYASLLQLQKYLDKLPVELTKNMMVVNSQKGPQKSGFQFKF